MPGFSEIEHLQASIAEAQGRLGSIRAAIDSLEKDIDLLSTRAIQLKRNIAYLKKKKIIVLASEYGKLKDELFLVRNKLDIIKINRESYRTSYALTEIEISKLKNKLVEAVNGPANNVIYGPFRRKND